MSDGHSPKHPMQPIVLDDSGVVRFKANQIVRWMYDQLKARGVSLNEIYLTFDVDREDVEWDAAGVTSRPLPRPVVGADNDDYQQLMQLIGYSVSGYGDLTTSPPEHVNAADRTAEKLLAARKAAGL